MMTHPVYINGIATSLGLLDFYNSEVRRATSRSASISTDVQIVRFLSRDYRDLTVYVLLKQTIR